MTDSSSRYKCMYCGEATRKGKKGEHIIPEAIGGSLTLNDISDRAVCSPCNSGVLSHLDRELCSRSYLSVIASQKISAHLWQAWDVDHAAKHLLVEAWPSWNNDGSLGSLTCYPQITFERTGPDVRADREEIKRFGKDDFAGVLFKAARRCFERYRAGEKRALHFEHIQSGVIRNGYRLAPRVFARRSISEIDANVQKQSFILRFSSQDDRRFALSSLENLGETRRLKNWSEFPGSRLPTFSFFFDMGQTLRALMKLGLNLVAAYCPNTPVNHESFPHPVRVIKGHFQIPPSVIADNGFSYADDVKSIKADDGGHSFRLLHLDGVWHIYSSFFGGEIGASVRFPGPNRESWSCADIVAPMRSKSWTFRPSRILQPLRVRVEWSEARVITPSLDLHNARSAVRVDSARRKL